MAQLFPLPRSGPLLLLLTTLALVLCGAHVLASPKRVAVIGAGIGGAFAAHSLALLSPDLAIDVFEASSHVGGRAQSFEFQGTTLELGASIIWSKNLHLFGAAQKLGLGIKQLQESPEEVSGFAVFNGQRFVLNQTGTAASMAKMALRYGPSPLLYSRHVLKVWEDSFQQIYTLQDEQQQRVFLDPEEMLLELGLFNLTQHSCAQHMQDFFRPFWWSWGASAFANDLAGAVNRCNYNQINSQLNALAGLISFMPAAAPDLWAVEGGNWRLPEALLTASNSTLHLRRAVTHISQGPGGSFQLSTSEAAAEEEGSQTSGIHGPYDSIIIATPLESANITFVPYSAPPPAPDGAEPTGTERGLPSEERLQGAQHIEAQEAAEQPGPEVCRWLHCSGGRAAPLAPPAAAREGGEAGAAQLRRSFQQTVTTYVSGQLQASYFGVQQLPSHRIFSSDDARLPFSSIGPKLLGGKLVYKVFSAEPLESNSSSSLLAQLFGPDVKVLASRAWAAYPRFSPPERFAPFSLGPGLCYVNALENAASAMEMSAIGARNCALMTARHLQRRQEACGTAAAAAGPAGAGTEAEVEVEAQ